MVRGLIVTIAMISFSCRQASQEKINNTQEITEKHKSNLQLVGDKIQGDFDGDGKSEFAYMIKIKDQKGNPMEDGTPAEYEIQFSNEKLKPINVGCCEVRLLNEGDLNNSGRDEISIFQAPMNGCTYSMTTFTYDKKVWKELVNAFLFPTYCDPISDEDLQKRVFKENNNIYYYKTDLNSEDGKLIKVKLS